MTLNVSNSLNPEISFGERTYCPLFFNVNCPRELEPHP